MTFSNAFSWMKMIEFRFKFVSKIPFGNKPPLVQAEQVTSHYRNQWWPSSLTHICGTRGRWLKDSGLSVHPSLVLTTRHLQSIPRSDICGTMGRWLKDSGLSVHPSLVLTTRHLQSIPRNEQLWNWNKNSWVFHLFVLISFPILFREWPFLGRGWGGWGFTSTELTWNYYFGSF